MRNFNRVTMRLFESSSARFKIHLESMLSDGSPDNKSLVYTTQSNCAVMNPQMYLVFTYKSDEQRNVGVYTSYNHLYRLRSAFHKIRDVVENDTAFDYAGEVVSVNPKYADPVVIENIGKKNNWIMLAPTVIQSGENGVVKTEPGVAITLSTGNNYQSLLVKDEFLTICEIIDDVNLPMLQMMVGFAALDAGAGMMPYGGMGQTMMYGAPQPAFTPYAQQAPQGYQAPQNSYTSQKYNNPNGFQRQSYGSNRQAPMAPAQAPQSPAIEETPMMRPMNNAAPAMPPRASNSAPIMNMKAVAETPVSDVDYDDTESLSSLFTNN